MKRMIEICNILLKYGDPYYGFWAEHDVIGFDIDYEDISKEDIERLEELRVFYSNEYDSLVMFV